MSVLLLGPILDRPPTWTFSDIVVPEKRATGALFADMIMNV